MTKKPELLAPAGSPEALSAAIEAGADAVYFGGALFSNRMRAKNFTDDELCSAIALASAYGVKSYITVNTRLRDRELSDAVSMAKELYSAGADAFIVADTGLAVALKNTLPSVELHASTQATGINSLDGEALKSLGFSRMVCPRELSMEELFRLVKDSPIEIEAFIHGAHCVSLSGQCLMSWAMGGRSGNRGECAQPCRLPYKLSCGKVKTGYPLSLKDMNLARHVPSLISSGVASLKIEGRLKSPDYVYGVTKIYRALLDEGRGATDAELKALDDIFSRDGSTDGYFKSRYVSMTGMRAEGTPSIGEKFTSLTRKIPVS
ncbi:MAG: U32 family peptidase, partial [Clostridia bacterium]|nr:U32 family peptidase [Clostridia bacterium]